ncbi:MAG TPA: transposase [Burkholderiales bacterium]
MARRPRIRLAGVPQHVLQRGNNRLPTFFSTADYAFYLESLRAAAEKHGCRVHVYVLMTNHVHLLATPSRPESVSLLMQDVGRRYVQHVNYRYNRTGTLWEGRFKASLVDIAAYFLTCSAYIELNPVRAAMVARPEDYSWSSYRFHAMGIDNATVSPHDEYLALGVDAEHRHAAYRDFCGRRIKQDQLDDIRMSTNKGWPLGRDRFKDEIEMTLSRAVRPAKRGRPRGGKQAASGTG